MSLISLVDASKDFGIRTLFEDLTLHIRDNDRVGLIGPPVSYTHLTLPTRNCV